MFTITRSHDEATAARLIAEQAKDFDGQVFTQAVVDEQLDGLEGIFQMVASSIKTKVISNYALYADWSPMSTFDLFMEAETTSWNETEWLTVSYTSGSETVELTARLRWTGNPADDVKLTVEADRKAVNDWVASILAEAADL